MANGVKTTLTIAGFVWLLALGGCATDQVANSRTPEQRELIRLINDSTSRGKDAFYTSAYSLAIGSLATAVEFAYELDPRFKGLEEEVAGWPELNETFTTMSLVHYMQNNYTSSLQMINKSLLFLPNTADEYAIKGDALYGLHRHAEALDSYARAIELDAKRADALHGMGQIYYEQGYYEQSIRSFDAYLKLVPRNQEAVRMRAYAHLYTGSDDKASMQAEKLVEQHPDSLENRLLEAEIIAYTEGYEAAKPYYEQIAERFSDKLDAQLATGDLHYENGEYELALEHYDRAAAQFQEEWRPSMKLMNAYYSLGRYEEAEEMYAKAAESSDISHEAHEQMAWVKQARGLHLEAADYYGKALALDPANENYAISKLQALYRSNRNDRCAEFGKTAAADIPATYSAIAWYTGKCSQEIGQYDDAASYFLQAAKIDPYDNEAWSELAYTYLLLDQDDKALTYSKRSLELYEYNGQAAYVQQAVENKSKPLGSQLRQFWEDYYLYAGEMPDWEDKLAGLDDDSLTAEQIAAWIEQARKQDDLFTFAVYGNDYDLLEETSRDEVEYRQEGGIHYFRIYTFHEHTDDQFIRIIDQIADSENEVLVLDLRGNGGGLTDSANRLLDALLPAHATSTMIDRDGYTESYFSDASQVKFGHIYVLIDEYTASSAEIIALSLKSYLNHVTLVGRQTFGKGVGQLMFDFKRERLLVGIVNFYWNVKQINIIDRPIKPDIPVSGQSLDSFMQPIREKHGQ